MHGSSDTGSPIMSEPKSPSRDTPANSAQNVIWIFGAPRSGTSWLAWMMRDLPHHQMWNEPYVGALFGDFYHRHNGDDQGADFILAPQHRRLWLSHVRALILEGASIRYEGSLQRGYLVIKEPHGSIGATLLCEALPESRLVLLLRDPRDVIASNLDSQRKGSWALSADPGKNWARPVASGTNPDAWVRQATRNYVRYMEVARQAHEAHPGPKALLTYEGLREDAAPVLERMYSDLRIPVSREDVARVAMQHAWERIPADKKGPRQFFRKASPGAWKDDLTEEQIATVEDITRPLLEQYYVAGR
jgi:hypothetical protein